MEMKNGNEKCTPQPGAKQQTYVALPIAFPERMSGTQCASTVDLAPSMGALNPTAVAVSLRGRAGGATAELGDEVQNCLRASGGGGDKAHVLASMAVRRLTPRECERLQGFGDDYTNVPHRGKPAADGNRYKALGNSWAVPNITWIGRRIDLVNSIRLQDQKPKSRIEEAGKRPSQVNGEQEHALLES